MLAELMRLKSGIAVAGAHGKTSTTSMIALALEHAGLDPTAVIGGRLRAFGSNARLGRGEYMVAEADESDRSFLKLSPTIAVVTNVDREHLEAYGGFEDLQNAFVAFANKVPFYGAVIACADDVELARLLPRMTRRVITYGITTATAEIGAVDVRLDGFGSSSTVVRRVPHAPPGAEAPTPLGTLRLEVPGRHSVLNALAALGVGLELGRALRRASPRRWPPSRAPSAASSGAAWCTASPSSTTTATIRRRSSPSSPLPAPRRRPGCWWPSSPIATREPRSSCPSSPRRWPPPTRSC